MFLNGKKPSSMQIYLNAKIFRSAYFVSYAYQSRRKKILDPRICIPMQEILDPYTTKLRNIYLS